MTSEDRGVAIHPNASPRMIIHEDGGSTHGARLRKPAQNTVDKQY